MNIAHFFLVTGKPYPGDPDRFTAMASTRAFEWMNVLTRTVGFPNALLATNDIARFVRFDFVDAGPTYPDGILYFDYQVGSAPPVPPGPWQPVSSFTPDPSMPAYNLTTMTARPNTPFYNDPQQQPLSIVDVYRTVRNAPTGSVYAVEIFSHGYVLGPVLTDTSDYADPANQVQGGVPVRAPSDTDGRARTDFTDYMGELPDSSNPPTNLAKFINGMSSKGSFRVYGCGWTEPAPAVDGLGSAYMLDTLHLVINQIYKRPMELGTPFGKILASHNVTHVATVVDQQQSLNMLQACQDERAYFMQRPGSGGASQVPTAQQFLDMHQAAFPDFFTGLSGGLLTHSLWDCIQFAAQVISSSYLFQAAKALSTQGTLTYGATPGSSAAMGSPAGSGLLIVPSSDRTYVQFFVDFLGATTLDKSGTKNRHYAILNAGAVANITTPVKPGSGS